MLKQGRTIQLGNPDLVSNKTRQYMDTGLKGFEVWPLYLLDHLDVAVEGIIRRLYFGLPLPSRLISDKHVSKSDRNRTIRARYEAGETLEQIARVFGISTQRVHQIVKR